MEAATRTHFLHHNEQVHGPDKDHCHFCQLRAFPSHRTLPITIVNTLNDEALPQNFRFIQQMKFGPGVEAASPAFLCGCDCENDSDCQYERCHCMGEIETAEAEAELNAYHMEGDKAGLLRSSMLDSTRPLYECHASCRCSDSCPNRVVERGRTVPLQIFRTKDRGWGVRCPETIRKGQFVDCYLGEIITWRESDQRRQASSTAERKDLYLFALDKFEDPTSHDPRLRERSFEVDGEFMSGPTRFINHSCNPNLRIFARVGDHANKHIHDLALFAVRDIARGEELTFDYVAGVDDHESNHDTTNMAVCLCGSSNCRGYLW